MSGRIILYIAMSLDGFIAKKDGNIDWLTKYDGIGEDYGFKDLYERIGVVLVGGNTYRQVPDEYKGKEAYVFTKRASLAKADNIHFVEGDIGVAVENVRAKTDLDMWLIGGGDLVARFLEKDLIDEYIITVVPVLLGDGIALFKAGNWNIDLNLVESKSYESGMMQMHYKRKDFGR